MNQETINAIAKDAAELGRQLYAEGVTDTDTQARIIAGAMPVMAEHEIAVHAITERAQGKRYGPREPDASPSGTAARLGC
jgi:hypothetical protein